MTPPSQSAAAPPARASALEAILIVLAVAAVGVGVAARVIAFSNSDPIGMTGDLTAVQQTWRDLSGDLAGGPSLRIKQHSFAILLGVIHSATGRDFAHAAALLAFLASVGTIFAGGLLVHSFARSRAELLAALVVFAVSPVWTWQTLRAESESPFIFFAALGTAALVRHWKGGSRAWLALAVPAWVVACGLRGPGVFHLLLFALAAAGIWILSSPESHPPAARFRDSLLSILLALVLHLALGAWVVRSTVRSYELRDGKRPAVPSYTTYIVYDGIVSGPFAMQTANWDSRESAVKSVDPKTGAYGPTPLTQGQSPLSLIWENRGRWAQNYAEGLWRVPARFLSDPHYNILGFWPLILGIGCLLFDRRREDLALLASWVAVYVLVIPGILVQDRTVWPASFGLACFGALFFGRLARQLGRSIQPRNFALQLAVFALLCGLLLQAGRKAWAISGTNVRDARKLARHWIEFDLSARGEPGSTPLLMTSDAGIVNYGRPVLFLQLPRNETPQDQRDFLKLRRPNYVLLLESDSDRWKSAYSAVRAAFAEPVDSEIWELIQASGRNELWRRTPREQSLAARFDRLPVVVFSAADPADAARLSPNPELALSAEGPNLRGTASHKDPVILLPPLDPASAKTAILRVDLRVARPSTFQLYFRSVSADSMQESQSVVRPLAPGLNAILLPLFPHWLKAGLRIDPIDLAGEFTVERLEIRAGP